MTRIYLLLRDPLLRLGMAAALREVEDFEVIGGGDDAAAALAQMQATPVDVLLADKAPQHGCALREQFPQVHVLVYVPHTREECVLRSAIHSAEQVFPRSALQKLDCCLISLKSCARGCVPRDATAIQLINSIRAVMAGEVAAGPWVSVALEEMPHGGRPASISSRELEILRHVAAGLTNKAIARRIGVREQTVKNHVSRIARKLGRRTRLELALFAIRSRITEN